MTDVMTVAVLYILYCCDCYNARNCQHSAKANNTTFFFTNKNTVLITWNLCI